MKITFNNNNKSKKGKVSCKNNDLPRDQKDFVFSKEKENSLSPRICVTYFVAKIAFKSP